MSDSEELRQRAEQYNHQLLTSEDQYVNELETIVNYIVKPLEKSAVRCKISGGEESVKKVFKYLNSMLQFHVTFLSVIRETISVIPDLYKYIGFITMYDDYLHHYDKILQIFSTWRSMEFREFITMRLKHKNVKKNIIDRLDSLPWYLYRPFDRIKEYHRFLKDIEKITKKTNDNYDLVNKTILKIRPLYKKIKQHEDRLQQKTRLLEVQLQIHGYNKTLVEDDRFFVYNRQCQMKRRGLPGKKYKQIHVYLFNDLFLWVSARGRFKGSYSFYKENLEIFIPSNTKKGDAIFSIGLKTEKHKRLIICADDLQRDKLMNTILKTYKQCQQKYFKTINDGTNKDLIKILNKKKNRETNNEIDMEFSNSSINTNFSGYNNYHGYHNYNIINKNEYSINSISDRSDRTDTEQTQTQTQKHIQSEHLNNILNTKRYTNHLKGPKSYINNNESSVDSSVKIPLNKSPEPSIISLDLENEINILKKELKIKNDRIKDLEQSNKTIRQTLILKDNKINSLQEQIQHLTIKMSKHNIRAKSISNVIRPSRIKRASSFSIGKGGKITRTVMLPSQINHNKKILKQKQNNGSQTPIINGRKKYPIQNISNLHTPHKSLQRSHSDHRKIKSDKCFHK